MDLHINSNAEALIAMQKIIIARKLSFNFLNQAEINKSSKMERVNSLMANVTWNTMLYKHCAISLAPQKLGN